MEDNTNILRTILDTEELEALPINVVEKLNKYMVDAFDEIITNKASSEAIKNGFESTRENFEKQLSELKTQLESYGIKIKNLNLSSTELRCHLNIVTSERDSLREQANKYESELILSRQDKNKILDERDSLLKVIERQNSELERFQEENKILQQQLRTAINAKCKALARADEIESKESVLEFKEKHMEQERLILTSQIQRLSEELNRNITELQNIRGENTMKNLHMETKFQEKLEELKIANSQRAYYKETIDGLTKNIQELNDKIYAQTKETNKMMEYYKKEIEAKSKLADIYKTNSEDTLSESNELEAAIIDLKRMLSEASEQYGELETKFKSMKVKHEQELAENNKIIDSLKSELLNANKLLKEVKHEISESTLSKLAPSAAVANRLIKSDMSLTEIYSLYVKANEQNEQHKRENNRLSLQLKTILQELEDRAPVLKKQELEFQKLVTTRNFLTQQLEEMVAKNADDQQEMQVLQNKFHSMERENKKLKHSQSDLSRQICFLLKEVEQHHFENSPNNRSQTLIGNLMTTDEVITKKLVTFKDITELQENNQKLLLLVRDLSIKLEESDVVKYEFSQKACQEKIENFVKKVSALENALQNQTKMLNAYMMKCERYKKLYFEAFQNSQKNSFSLNSVDEQGTNNDFNKISRKDGKEKDKRIIELQDQLVKANNKIKMHMEQFDYYTKEKKNNEKILNEQFDAMRTEVRELTSTNCKLMSSVDYNKEQIKILHKNIGTYKQQINALENRNKNYENTIIKHEQTILYLKDETMKSQKGLSATEIEANYLRQESQVLKDSIARLQSEKEVYHTAKQSQSLLLNNLEMIKACFERSEVEGRSRLEARLDEMSRELSAQRRRYQEEQDRFRDSVADLKRQADTARERMEEEKVLAEKYREEKIILRDELASKSRRMDELSKKLQEILTPSDIDNPIALANKKIKELEFQLEELKLEKISLCTELEKTREHSEQYFKMSQSAEKEIKNLHDLYSQLKNESEKDITALHKKEAILMSRVEELETDIQLQNVKELQNEKDGMRSPQQLAKAQEELKDALQKLSETNRELRTVRSDLNNTSELLNAVEQKYANEMIQHSTDIQQITKLKEDLTKNREQIEQLKNERDKAVNALKQNKKDYIEEHNLLKSEKEELINRLMDMNAQNALLHNQIDVLSSRMSTLDNSSYLSTSAFSSSVDGNDVNKSLVEEETKNSEQLLQIIKFLRKEKDISVAKIDILKAENIRIITELNILQKKNDELNGFLNQERTKSETVIVTANRHEEILRKIETLNAVTDSNRILREERDLLNQRVKDLKDHINKIEDELIPLQKQNSDLSAKIEEYCTEINSLKTEAIKWRQRANLLIEKSNKNPEEFRRLQAERENLAKMLTSEKDQLKKVTEEITSIKNEKLKLEAEVASLSRQIQSQVEEKKKLFEDFNALKQTNARITQEVMEIKTQLLQKEEMMQKISEELESKEIQLQDSKNKEVQIRKIAKRYKDSFIELSNKVSNVNGEGSSGTISSQDNIELASVALGGCSNEGTTPVSASPLTTSKCDSEKDLKTKIELLNNTIKTTQEEYEKLRRDYEELKTTADKDERGKILLREAKTRIVSLTESKNAISQELATIKSKLQSYKQSSDDHDAMIIGIKAQYEEVLSQTQKDMTEQNNQCKEIINRLNRENESLLMRINQLCRQLGLQQAIKPSTSSGAVSDKNNVSELCPPRTANVKPMSGSTGQQSATFTPWRGVDTPLASIRPISVQNSRTAAVLPTSQNNIVVQGSSSSSNTTNTALVPPQQQVHTTGSNIESLASSPTSTHIDYMPSTSSATVAVATIPPMGAVSIAESSQEAESVLLQNIEPQVMVNIGQQQAVALVSPRVEASLQNMSPNMQNQETSNQPSTSGTSNSSHASVNTQSRHAYSSSNVTTTQATASHKRPRDVEGYSSTNVEDCEDKCKTKTKRVRIQSKSEQSSVSQIGFAESGVDVEYQVPTSSQRDQEDDIIVVDSEDDGMADEGNAEVEEHLEEGENENYEDSYEQDHEIDENECTEIGESQIQADNNEVEIVQSLDTLVQGVLNNHVINLELNQLGNHSPNQRILDSIKDGKQQIQAISSGSSELTTNLFQSSVFWKQPPNFSRQHKSTPSLIKENDEIHQFEDINQPSMSTGLTTNVSVPEEETSEVLADADTLQSQEAQKCADENETSAESSKFENALALSLKDPESHESTVTVPSQEALENEIQLANESQNLGASQSEPHMSCHSEVPEIQQNQIEGTVEHSEFIDGVSSEGEKTVVADVEEEGREAEASTSPSVNTRSKSIRNTVTSRKLSRGCQRGGRPTPIIWQDHQQDANNQRNQETPGSPSRGFQNQRTQRARRIRRPGGSNYGNMRYQ